MLFALLALLLCARFTMAPGWPVWSASIYSVFVSRVVFVKLPKHTQTKKNYCGFKGTFCRTTGPCQECPRLEHISWIFSIYFQPSLLVLIGFRIVFFVVTIPHGSGGWGATIFQLFYSGSYGPAAFFNCYIKKSMKRYSLFSCFTANVMERQQFLIIKLLK